MSSTKGVKVRAVLFSFLPCDSDYDTNNKEIQQKHVDGGFQVYIFQIFTPF